MHLCFSLTRLIENINKKNSNFERILRKERKKKKKIENKHLEIQQETGRNREKTVNINTQVWPINKHVRIINESIRYE